MFTGEALPWARRLKMLVRNLIASLRWELRLFHRLIGLFGIAVTLFIAWLASRNRKSIRWRRVFFGLALQFGFAISILGIPAFGVPGIFRFLFTALNATVTELVDTVAAGSKFLFGPLAEVRDPWGFVFAFRVLPTIVFFSSLMALLYYLGILQRIVKAFAWLMQKTLHTSGAETLSGTANIFMGQTEAPLLVRPYIAGMTRSEIYCVMVGGMSTLPAGVEAAYIGLLRGRLSDIAGHLMTASVLGAMGGFVISKIIFSEVDAPVTAGKVSLEVEVTDSNPLEAISRGASDGVTLALNVGAMLIAFIALIAVFNAGLAKVGSFFHLAEPLSFSLILGFLCQPLAWLIGVPWADAKFGGATSGRKKLSSTNSLRTCIYQKSARI